MMPASGSRGSRELDSAPQEGCGKKQKHRQDTAAVIMPYRIPNCSPLYHAYKEEGPSRDLAEATCGGSQRAAANLGKVEAAWASAQPFSQPSRAEADVASLSGQFSRATAGEAASASAPTECSAPATETAAASAALAAPYVPSVHVGAISWSRVPGFCGSCGAPTSRWSCPNGDPPWLPLIPHSRVHLRLLWDFYAASLPTSCSAMQEAITMGDLSALRAEAALLSLMSKGLGFTSLSESARRLAEICDLKDTGTPNPSWGPHHPFAAAEWTDISRLDTSEAKWVVQQQQHASSCRTHYSDDVAAGDEQLLLDGSVCECRKPVSVAGSAHTSSRVLETPQMKEVLANQEAPRAGITQAAGARNSSFAEGFYQHTLPSHAMGMRARHTQQPHQYPFQRSTKRREHEQDNMTEELRRRSLFLIHSQQLLHGQRHPLESKHQASHGHQKQQERQQKQHCAAAHFDSLHHRMGVFGNAVATCLMDLHAAKATLAPLFQEGTTATAAAGSAVAPTDKAAAEHKSPALARKSYLEALQRFMGFLAALAAALKRSAARAAAANLEEAVIARRITATATLTAIAAPALAVKAVIAAAKAALRHATVWGRIDANVVAGLASSTAPDTVAWLTSSFSGTWRFAAAPRLLFLDVSEKTAPAATATYSAASTASAAFAAALERCTACSRRATVLLEQWLRTASIPGTALSVPTLLLQLLKQVLEAAQTATSRRWDSLRCLVKRVVRCFAAAQQQLLRLLVLRETAGVAGFDTSTQRSLWPGSSYAFSRNCKSKGNDYWRARRNSRGSPRETAKGLRRGGMPPTCYWSPKQSTMGDSSAKKPTESTVLDLVVPASQQQEEKQAPLADQRLLQHHLQTGSASMEQKRNEQLTRHQWRGPSKAKIDLIHQYKRAVDLGSGVPLSLGSWQAPRFYVYEAGEVPGVPKDLLYIKESAWGPAAAQVGPAPVFLGKHLELQATPTNQTPLRGRKTIEIGAGCGLVSMVAALLGAEAHACEESGPTFALLQHNVATFNSEFTKCHAIRACKLPAPETLRGVFDLLFVTDLLNSSSARIKTLNCLLLLLGPQTDGSIDIFSVKPHANVSEGVWRSELKDLLLQLLREEATQKGTNSPVTPQVIETAIATMEEAPTLCLDAKGTDRNAASLSNCSTLSSMQVGVQLAPSRPSSGALTPAERLAPGEDFKESLVRLPQREAAVEGSAGPATATRIGANASSRAGLLRNMSQPLLHQSQLPLKSAHTAEVAAAKTSKSAPKGATEVTASSREPGSPGGGTPVRPKTSTSATAAARGGCLNVPQHMYVNRDGSPNTRVVSATAPKGLAPPRPPSAARGPSNPRPAAATKPTPPANGKVLPRTHKPMPAEPRESNGGMRSIASTAVAPKAAAEAAPPRRATEASLQNPTATGTTRKLKILAGSTTDLLKPATSGRPAKETVVPAKAAPSKSSKSARSETLVPASQLSSKRMGPLLPALGAPNAQPKRATADGSPTPLQEAAGAPLQPRRKSLLGRATGTTIAAATAAQTAAAATDASVAAVTASLATGAEALTLKSTHWSAAAFDRYAATNTGVPQQMLNATLVAASEPTPRQESAAGSWGGGSLQLPSATAAAPKPITGAPVLVSRPKQAGNSASEGAKADAVTAESPKQAAVGTGATKSAAVAVGQRGESEKPQAPLGTKTHAAAGNSTSAAGPLGARLVSRLSVLFKRSGSKEMKSK
ncbi:hypothetical protein, conserved [Eimeria praecox]|uniref:Uncharacterized protein n=1 Tax=Eimeria praecox TaxID=51316 RepID=U6H2A2_9EIME|nr:hypothetical protein, conserved [Eimeria praecox]